MHPESGRTNGNSSGTAAQARWRLLWKIVWTLAALAYAVPVATIAYERLNDVAREARQKLIVEYRLWELHPEYRGTPQQWTRFASRLLTDNQLLSRVRVLHRDLAREIELDYRRDLTMAQGEVVLVAIGAWALPVGALYGIGYLLARRRRAAPAQDKTPARPVYSEAKYRPDYHGVSREP